MASVVDKVGDVVDKVGDVVEGVLQSSLTATTTTVTTTTVKPEAPMGYEAVILLGAAAFIMMLFYMVNAHIREVREKTWGLLATAVSIYVAVMFNQMVNYMLSNVFKLNEVFDETSLPAGWADVGSHLLQVFLLWCGVTSLLFCFKTSPLRLKAYGTIGGHIMGFANIGLWGAVCAMDPFRTSPWWIVPVVLLMDLVFLAIFTLFFRNLGACFGKCSKVSAKDQESWHEQASDTGTDFMCLGMAFLVATWIKFLIYGKYDPALTSPAYGRDAWQPWTLFAVGFGFLILTAIMSVVSRFYSGCFTDFLTTIFATVSAMLYLDTWDWWFLPTAPAPLIGKLQIAVQISMFCAAVIIIIAFIDRCMGKQLRSLRGVFTGLGLAVGSSWEKTFDAATDALDEFGIDGMKKILISMLLVVIVFPAWVAYILPKSDPELEKEYKAKPPAFWACCGDCDPCSDDEEEAYDDIDGEEE